MVEEFNQEKEAYVRSVLDNMIRRSIRKGDKKFTRLHSFVSLMDLLTKKADWYAISDVFSNAKGSFRYKGVEAAIRWGLEELRLAGLLDFQDKPDRYKPEIRFEKTLRRIYNNYRTLLKKL